VDRKAKIGVFVGAIAIVVLAGGAVASASIPDGNGTFSGCVDAQGHLRMIDPSAGGSCRQSPAPLKETQISWTQQGVPGQQGPQGPQGVPGPQGPQGDPGAAGVTLYGGSHTAQTFAAGSTIELGSKCPNGDMAIGRNLYIHYLGTGIAIANDGQFFGANDPSTWVFLASNNTTQDVLVELQALCAHTG
jgi:hypothetical protein